MIKNFHFFVTSQKKERYNKWKKFLSPIIHFLSCSWFCCLFTSTRLLLIGLSSFILYKTGTCMQQRKNVWEKLKFSFFLCLLFLLFFLSLERKFMHACMYIISIEWLWLQKFTSYMTTWYESNWQQKKRRSWGRRKAKKLRKHIISCNLHIILAMRKQSFLFKWWWRKLPFLFYFFVICWFHSRDANKEFFSSFSATL
jgi:hypothetical protein